MTGYFWYREHPYLPEIHEGQILDVIRDENVILQYLPQEQERLVMSKLFPNGLSPHGLSMLIPQKLGAKAKEPCMEIIFELIRQQFYPEMPCRLTCLYATQSIKQAELWKALWEHNFPFQAEQQAKELWVIDYQTSSPLLDASFLKTGESGQFSYLQAIENAHRYWRGEQVKNPLLELLVSFPVTVVRPARNTHPE